MSEAAVTMQVKYFHFNHKNSPFHRTMQSYTAVAGLPTADHVRTILAEFLRNEPVSVTMDFGYTKVHPKDNYSKKIGRAQAALKIKDITLTVKKVEITPTHMYVIFEEMVDNEFRIMFRLNTKTNHVTVMCHDLASY